MPVEGAVAERARAVLPVTWDALMSDPRYGDVLLQTAVDTVKQAVFGVVVAPSAESGYTLAQIDYTAKLVALELIAPGIDFWMNQPTSESATGTNENHGFVDRADRLRLLREQLLVETRSAALALGLRRRSTSAPLLSTMDDELLTPSPQEFPRPYARTGR